MIRSIIQIPARLARTKLPASVLLIPATRFVLPVVSLTENNVYWFAKISKKQKDKQKSDEQKKKVKQSIGDIKSFDLAPFEQRYNEIIDSYKQTISQYKVGRLDPSIFSSIHVKVGHNNLPIQQLAEVAPKSSNSCVLNPFDQDNLDIIQKGVQASDLGFQVTRVDKTILVTQLPNSMKEIKEKMLVKLKKNHQNYKDRFGKIRNDAREELKKFKKVIPQQRSKAIQKQLNALHDKQVASFEKLNKDKQAQLKK